MTSYTLTELNSGEVHKNKNLDDAVNLILSYDGRMHEVRKDEWGYALWYGDRYGWRESVVRSYASDPLTAVTEIYRKVLSTEAFLTEYEVDECK